MRSFFILLSLITVFMNLSAQVHEKQNGHADNTENKAHEALEKYKIAFTLGVTHIPAAFEHGHEEAAVFVPTIGLDFFYYFNHKWSMSLVADLEFAEYIVPFNREDLNREKALILALQAGYEVAPHWGIMLGGGIEIESHKNLGVVRLGTEYEIPLGDGWELAPSLFFDFKQDFSTYALAVGLGKRF